MATILIRNVPKSEHKALRHMSVNRGCSLNHLLLEILHQIVKSYSADAKH